jgi:hypothetical protein
MKLIEEMCDQYNLRARVLPAFLLVLPITLGVVAVFPAADQGPVGIAAGILAFIVLYQLSDWVRERGLAAQDELYRQWGGKPSVLLLSHFQTVIAPDTLVRCHNKLRELDPRLPLPQTREEEQADPGKAADAYRSCNELLLERTRDKAKFCLLHEENIRYGARRNMYGVRWVALGLAVAGLVAGAAAGGYRAYHGGEPDAFSVVTAATGLLLSLFWLLVVRAAWVRRQADTYAARLILSAQTIESKEPKPGKEPG